MTIYQKMQMQFIVICSMLFTNFAMAASSVDTAPATAGGFVDYLTAVGTSMGTVNTAVVTIMGIIILVMGIISLGGIVAGLLKKMFG